MEMGHTSNMNADGAGGDYSRNEYAGAYEAQDRRAVPQAVPAPRSTERSGEVDGSGYGGVDRTMSSGYGDMNGGAAHGGHGGVNRSTGQDSVMIDHAGRGFDKVQPARNF